MFDVIRFVTSGSFVTHTTAAVYSYITSYEHFKHHLSRVTFDEEHFRAYIVSFKQWGRNYEFRFLKRLSSCPRFDIIQLHSNMYPKALRERLPPPVAPAPKECQQNAHEEADRQVLTGDLQQP